MKRPRRRLWWDDWWGMIVTLMNLLRACWRPSSNQHARAGSDVAGRQDGLLWYKDTGQHVNGEFSMAVVQANNLLEDQCQIESGPLSFLDSGPYGTFVGVYDGHGGPETACYINDHLFHHLKSNWYWQYALVLFCTTSILCFRAIPWPFHSSMAYIAGFASEQNSMSADVLKKAYEATEDGFFSVVTKQWPVKPQIAAVGSCCLVGVICGGILYVANVGDSRVVLGRHVKATGEVLAVQLSAEHNVSIESVRKELQSMHPEDRHIVVLKHNVWRVKGLIQVSSLSLWKQF